MPNTNPTRQGNYTYEEFEVKERLRKEYFQRFCRFWYDKLDCQLDALAGKYDQEQSRRQENEGGVVTLDNTTKKRLADRVALHYKLYNKSMSLWNRDDVHETDMDRSLTFISGWRPSRAFHALYKKSGAQMKARLDDILLRGLEVGDLGDLSESQLRSLDALEIETKREEEAIENLLKAEVDSAKETPKVAELPEMIDAGVTVGDALTNIFQPHKVETLFRVWEMADDLRISTVIKLEWILNHKQFAHFQISAAEMELGIQEWIQNNGSGGGSGGGGDHGQEEHRARENASGGDRDQVMEGMEG